MQINITNYLLLHRTRRFSVVFITTLLGLFQTSCSDGTSPVSEFEQEHTLRLNIKITNAFPDEPIRADVKRYSRTREELIQQVFLYVFNGEAPVKLRDVRYTNGIVSAILPPLSEKLSAFVIANEAIEAPVSKQDLLRRMARTSIGRGGIPATGMPMGSGEVMFRLSPLKPTNVTMRLERCHSAIYIETPGGNNSNYQVYLRGEQQREGPLISGSQMLASSSTNSNVWTQGYELSNVSTREAVAYYYPTDGNIEIKVQPRNTSLPPMQITLDRTKAKLRNRKYIFRIVPGVTDGNTKSETAPHVTLIEEE